MTCLGPHKSSRTSRSASLTQSPDPFTILWARSSKDQQPMSDINGAVARRTRSFIASVGASKRTSWKPPSSSFFGEPDDPGFLWQVQCVIFMGFYNTILVFGFPTSSTSQAPCTSQFSGLPTAFVFGRLVFRRCLFFPFLRLQPLAKDSITGLTPDFRSAIIGRFQRSRSRAGRLEQHHRVPSHHRHCQEPFSTTTQHLRPPPCQGTSSNHTQLSASHSTHPSSAPFASIHSHSLQRRGLKMPGHLPTPGGAT